MLKLGRITLFVFGFLLIVVHGAVAEESTKVDKSGRTFVNPELMKTHRIIKREISTDLLTALDEINAHLGQLYDFHNNQEESIVTNVTKLEQKLQESESELQKKTTELQQMLTSANAKIENLQLEKLDMKQKLKELEAMLHTSTSQVAKVEQKIQNSELEIIKLHQNITDIKNQTKLELDEIKQEIQNIEPKLNQTIETLKFNVTELSTEIVEITKVMTNLEQKLQEAELRSEGKCTQLEQKVESLEVEKLDMKQKLNELETMLQTSSTQVAKAEQKLQDSELEIIKLHQNIIEIRNQTMEKLYEMKQTIQNMTRQEQKQTIDTPKLNITKPITKIVQNTLEVIPNQKPGRVVSIRETTKLVDKQSSGCGGILVGLSGEIRYESPSNLTRNQHSNEICIWTIRANRKYEVKFQLVADTLGESELRFNGLFNIYPGDLSSQTKTIRSGHHTEFTLNGHIMFVTLVPDSVGPLSFTLKYEGIGDDTSTSRLYSHYHFTESAGSVDFPRIRGDTKYSPEEIATFVINPTIPTSALRIQTTKVDTEKNYKNCWYDTLSHFAGNRNQSGYYKVDGPSSTRNRYCGQLGSLRDAFSGGQGTETFISVFLSDSGVEYSGFTFNWTS